MYFLISSLYSASYFFSFTAQIFAQYASKPLTWIITIRPNAHSMRGKSFLLKVPVHFSARSFPKAIYLFYYSGELEKKKPAQHWRSGALSARTPLSKLTRPIYNTRFLTLDKFPAPLRIISFAENIRLRLRHLCSSPVPHFICPFLCINMQKIFSRKKRRRSFVPDF